MAKSSVTKAELEDLKSVGYIEGNKDTIPDNISPVLKAKLLREIEGDTDPLDHDADGRKGGHVDNRGKAVKK